MCAIGFASMQAANMTEAIVTIIAKRLTGDARVNGSVMACATATAITLNAATTKATAIDAGLAANRSVMSLAISCLTRYR